MIKEEIHKALAQLEFIKYNKGFKVDAVDIGEIPDNWQFFNDTTDLWKKVNYNNENICGCLYKPQPENLFKAHVHNNSDEFITNMIENTSFTVYTPKWKKVINYGESVYIPRGLAHLIIWNNTNMLVNIFWHPAMKGWQGDFIDK